MIKLIENELVKIFKRKSIYFLLILSVFAILIYNYKNPDQNVITNEETSTMPMISTDYIESIKNEQERYINLLAHNEFAKLYNDNFEEDSWQRYALNIEKTGYSYENTYDQDIMNYLYNIMNYEYYSNNQITKELYETSKHKYNEYVEALKSDDWKNFVNLKLENLQEIKKEPNLLPETIKEIDFEIEWYKLRLNNNIIYGDDILNQYLNSYREKYYLIIYKELNIDKNSQSEMRELFEEKSKLEICKYAIENHIKYDISNEENIISNNKIDARISFIRTFSHFDLILIIITIYISSTTITEEITKKTIKNMLTKPHKRMALIMAKIIACLITIIVSMYFIGIIQFLVGGFIFGFDSYANGYIGYDINTNSIFNMSLLYYFIIMAFIKIFEYLIICLFCLFIGVFNKNIAMSMILTLLICLFANTALAEWSKVDALSKITRYFITNNWDFSIYLFGNISNVNGTNLWHSILIYFIYFVLLFKLTISKFNKIEI